METVISLITSSTTLKVISSGVSNLCCERYVQEESRNVFVLKQWSFVFALISKRFCFYILIFGINNLKLLNYSFCLISRICVWSKTNSNLSPKHQNWKSNDKCANKTLEIDRPISIINFCIHPYGFYGQKIILSVPQQIYTGWLVIRCISRGTC